MKKALLLSICAGLLSSMAMAQDCCADKKKEAKADAKAGQCATKTADCGPKAAASCGTKMASQEDAFMAEAKKMSMQAYTIEKKKDACCQSTQTKVVAKGSEGCCNAKGETAKFKVFVAGVGYKYFGCEDSAAKGRKELLAKHTKVGAVQKVNGKISIS